MATKAEVYAQRAEEFEARAKETRDPTVRQSYEDLARSYRQLAGYMAQPSNRNG